MLTINKSNNTIEIKMKGSDPEEIDRIRLALTAAVRWRGHVPEGSENRNDGDNLVVLANLLEALSPFDKLN